MAGEKILDIDDSPTVQRLIEMILTTQGYRVVLASDGEEGVAKARAEKPAVILVDFVMPKMNGFQVCKELKEDPEFKDTPIILVTSKGDKVGSKFVDVLGITEYFTKPFQPEELLAKIREVIEKKKQPSKPLVAEKESRPTATAGPAMQAAQNVVESMVRNVVEQVMEDFINNVLPKKIQQELAKLQPLGGASIQGDLATVSIAEVMQMLGLQRQTGKLLINNTNEALEVYFKNGQVVFAAPSANGASPTQVEILLKKSCKIGDDGVRHVLRIAEMTSQPVDGVLVQEKILNANAFNEILKRHTESVVYKAMTLKQGAFSFEKASAPVFAHPINLKVDDLLLEGARRADEWGLIVQKIPDFSIIFEPMIGNADELSTRGMSETDLKVFSFVNGRRTVHDIIDQIGLSEFDVAKSIFILLTVNLIRRKG